MKRLARTQAPMPAKTSAMANILVNRGPPTGAVFVAHRLSPPSWSWLLL